MEAILPDHDQNPTMEMEFLSTHTTTIVSAYLQRNQVNPSDIPAIIQQVHSALSGLGNTTTMLPAEPLRPAVPLRRSITPDYLICLEDGKKLKMLRRHLSSTYGMTPDDYRKKWGLPSDYPMVSPNYSESRSVLAKKLGLGTARANRRQVAPQPAPAARSQGRGRGRRRAEAAA